MKLSHLLLLGALVGSSAVDVWAEGEPVALVYGQLTVNRGGSTAREIPQYFGIMRDLLNTVGVPFAVVKDTDLKPGALAGFKIAVFPHNPVFSEPELEALEQFLAGGGKIFCFYTSNVRVLKLLGLTQARYVSQAYRGQFSLIYFPPDRGIAGLPEQVDQGSWNIQAVQPAGDGAEVLGYWYTHRGRSARYPALWISSAGVYMTHVLTRSDWRTKQRMMLALLGHFVPELWALAIQHQLQRVGRVSKYEGLAALRTAVAEAQAEGRKVDAAQAALAEAERLQAQAQRLLQAKEYPQALDTALSATQQAANAFYALQPSRRPELRAAWIHSAYGVPGWGWEKTIRVLAENGFNAIFPNMLWGGVAHYPSRYLPIAQTATYDQIAECLYWCRKYGLELHVWKVNYNLGPAPEEFVQKLRAEGRLQADREGNEIKWLSPSHPDNFALERDAMLEVVRNYNVDGIHFDYIRYPHANADYSEGARQRFEKETGVKVQNWPEEVITGPYRQIFARWRREQITKLVAAVSKEARKIRPRIKISAAVFADWADSRESIGQDTRLWIERGYLDFVCPMDYTPNNDRLVRWVQRQAGWVAGRVPLYIGIGAFRHPDPVRTVEQINLARQYGADGFVIFQHSSQFGERFLPALHRGVTAVAARPTHLAARVKFHLPPGLPEYGGRWYLEGKPITVSVELERTPVREERWAYVRGAVELRAPNDEPILNFGQLRLLVGERKELHLTLPAGRFRLAFAGRGRRRGSWEYEPILVRGPMVTTITRSVYEAEQAKYRPPRGKGIKVGIWPRGYGSGGIYRALQRVRGVRPFLLRTLDEETLRQCEVLILAQPRPGRGPRGEWVAALRAFVEQGGGLLVTHDAVGFRDLPAILPEIAQGAAREETKQWRIAQEHAITAGLALDQTYEHTYYDHIVLQAGEKGTVLVGSAEKPLVIIGEWGRGRYVACGLALGLDPRDRDVEPSEAELALLVHAVEWLGRAEERERKRQRPWPL